MESTIGRPSASAVLAIWLFLGFISVIWPVTALRAQAGSCTIQVFYGDEGVDQGACTDMGSGLCRTREYALEQGKLICPDEVQVMSGGLLRDVYRSPQAIQRQPMDWLLTTAYWIVPFVVGGMAGWLLGRWSNKVHA